MDTLTARERSERMSRIKGKNTKPELLVRSILHAKGYRYRLHGRAGTTTLPGRPDLPDGVGRTRRSGLDGRADPADRTSRAEGADQPWAFSYASRIVAGTRPRSLTS